MALQAEWIPNSLCEENGDATPVYFAAECTGAGGKALYQYRPLSEDWRA